MCGNCKKPFLKEDLEKHTEEGGCKKAYKIGQRCHLCDFDFIPAALSGWRDHYLTAKCAKNPRN
jgi:hypothetical protein